MNVVSISPITWYTDVLRSSGVEEAVADFAGITLDTDGFKMPYHDIDGLPIGIASKRFNTDDKSKRYKRVEGVGLPIAMYWPLHPALPRSHRTLLGENILHELWITEGERKSLCLQSEMLGQGIPGSAVSMPGISVWKTLIEEVERAGIQFAISTGMNVVRRRVVLCYDWNKENEQVRASEANLYDYFTKRGAEVVVLRWATTSDDEQKIDDWLVSGGKLADALRDSPAFTGGNAAMHDYNERFAVLGGRIAQLGEKSLEILTHQQFLVQTKNEFDYPPPDSKSKKKLYHAERWLEWGARRTISRMVFIPPSIGGEVVQSPPEYNIAPSWPALGTNNDFTIFDNHLARFCESAEHHAWLRCHFAHMMLFPNEITSNALCFADSGNTGKGLLFSLLSRVLGEFFTLATSESISGRFNASLAKRLLVVYDEPREDRFKNLEAACKSLVGNPTIVIEGKGANAYSTDNRLRLVITCNLAYAARLDKADRRWNYFGATEVMERDAITQFIEFSNQLHDWRAWAHEVYGGGDWCGANYSPTRLGPVSKLREAAIKHSQSIYLDILDDEAFEGKDVWSTAAINDMAARYGLRHNPTKLGMELARIGAAGHNIKSGGKLVRVRAVRNFTRWSGATHGDLVAEYEIDPLVDAKF